MTIGRKTGGRVRTIFCDDCKINPKPARECSGCRNISWVKYKHANRARINKLQRERIAQNPEPYRAKKRQWKQENRVKVNAQELIRKDKTRYGEFASAHRSLIKLKKLIKENKNGTSN